MKLLDLTLDSPAENLALDEALLEAAHHQPSAFGQNGEMLRLWEPRQRFVVVGSSSKLAEEVNLNACREKGVPILRRASGGCAIVAGPGCLMYAVVLGYEGRAHLRNIDEAHRHVLTIVAAALRSAALDADNAQVAGPIQRAGISDLIWCDRKISGNSLRCKRRYFLYHGTILYRFPLHEIGQLLRMPARQPGYRAGRDHHDFVANLPLRATSIRRSVAAAFGAVQPVASWPRDLTARLVAEKYGCPEWNLRL